MVAGRAQTNQLDSDGDGIGDACDTYPRVADPDQRDRDGGVVDGDTALGHHGLQLSVAEFVLQVPGETRQDDRFGKVARAAALVHPARPNRPSWFATDPDGALPCPSTQLQRIHDGYALLKRLARGKEWSTCCCS